jgi:hypothetical protein
MATRAMAGIGAAVFAAMAALAAEAQGAPSTAVASDPPTINVGVRAPPADEPLITNIPRPAFSVEGGAGVLGYIGGTGQLGPAWNLRVTGEFTPRFAAEANYLGAANRRSDDAGTLTYTSLDARVRYNVLLADQAPVQPYLAAGLGYAAWIGPGGAPAGLVIPVTVGVERMLAPNVKIGARLDVRPSFFEDLGYGD